MQLIKFSVSSGTQVSTSHVYIENLQKKKLNCYTVNVVIFAGGNFRENVDKTFHVGVIFTIFSWYYSYFLHKGIWVLFSRGGNFREEDKSAKNVKITPTRNFPGLRYRKWKLDCFLVLWKDSRSLEQQDTKYHFSHYIVYEIKWQAKLCKLNHGGFLHSVFTPP